MDPFVTIAWYLGHGYLGHLGMLGLDHGAVVPENEKSDAKIGGFGAQHLSVNMHGPLAEGPSASLLDSKSKIEEALKLRPGNPGCGFTRWCNLKTVEASGEFGFLMMNVLINRFIVLQLETDVLGHPTIACGE